MNRAFTCCFTGHRKLPIDVVEKIIKRLNCEVDNLISQGVTDFISGGAPGFDQLAASLIIAKKEMGSDIRLIFVLPCKNQEELWSADQKKLYCNLLADADEVIYISKEYHDGCMQQRNRYMVDHSSSCVCALLHPFGVTNQTVKYAKQKGLKVINVAD
jgi:uncharacterized phage-like protein YoqJ